MGRGSGDEKALQENCKEALTFKLLGDRVVLPFQSELGLLLY